MKKERRTQEQRRQEAQEKVLQAAIEVFADKGFQDANLEDIADVSGLTIRPIYHYFGSKKGLFLAVTELLEQQLTDNFRQAITDQSQSILAGWNVFVEQSKNPAFRQIVLIDAPNVLGRERWHNSPVIKFTQKVIQPLMPASPAHAKLASRMLLVALAEAALLIAENEGDEFIQAANDIVGALLHQFENTIKQI